MRTHPHILAGALALVAPFLAPPIAHAQEAINTGAATQPSPGHTVLREQIRFTRLRDDPTGRDREVEQWSSVTSLIHGITSDISFSLSAPLVYREVDAPDPADSGSVFDLDDVTAMMRWRVLRHDTGPIDTLRVSLLTGLEIPTFTSVSSDSWDPIVGAVGTMIRGRHGLSLSGQWKFNTGTEREPLFAGKGKADLLRYDAAYLYRVSPADYADSSDAAIYAVLEMNGLYETNGDHEVFLAPGVLFEGRRFAAEASLQLPAIQKLDRRPETRFAITIGVRFLF
ncbi:MAG: hypothetical protein EA376_12880 [Phycisphaeraceae bacterium]|nr:MAG: hypothetical protein EA376_12880 [Phycisphaeraceae bacterium]